MPQRVVLDRAPVGAAPPSLAREGDRRRRLTVMRRWATGMLVVVSTLWLLLVAVGPSGGWVGYARAALEASMVGALADWFAVTALFRRPLGLPIPHTAVVVERKEQFGRTLAAFFRENFLSGAAVAERVRSSGAVARAATWLADPGHATTLARNVLRRGADVLDTTSDDIAGFVVREARDLAAAAPVAQLSARLVRAAGSSTMLDDAIEVGCTAAQAALVDHAPELELTFARDRPWWLPEAVQRRLFEHLVERAVVTLDEIATQRSHPARARLRSWLTDLADRLERDPELAQRLESLQDSVLHDPRLDDVVSGLVTSALCRFRTDARTPGSTIEQRLVDGIVEIARRVRDERALHTRIEQSVESTVDRALVLFGGDIDALVTGTISHWDAARTAEQLELLLGPDLQYIRINGTVVGALAGLSIFALGQVIG